MSSTEVQQGRFSGKLGKVKLTIVVISCIVGVVLWLVFMAFAYLMASLIGSMTFFFPVTLITLSQLEQGQWSYIVAWIVIALIPLLIGWYVYDRWIENMNDWKMFFSKIGLFIWCFPSGYYLFGLLCLPGMYFSLSGM